MHFNFLIFFAGEYLKIENVNLILYLRIVFGATLDGACSQIECLRLILGQTLWCRINRVYGNEVPMA